MGTNVNIENGWLGSDELKLSSQSKIQTIRCDKCNEEIDPFEDAIVIACVLDGDLVCRDCWDKHEAECIKDGERTLKQILDDAV